jgi:predicted HAD superfamily Cof-like phosphohydrolase
MTNEYMQVTDFMLEAGQKCPIGPEMPSKEIRELRLQLISEELHELAESFSMNNLEKSYDAILDLLYVVIGTAVAIGLDIEPGFQEVHRSNMTKFIDGHRRADGKWVKGPSYSPANLEPIIKKQIEEAEEFKRSLEI